jgi:putative peptidoglycan lipid II flippase
VTVLSAAGSALGLVRDLTLAALFGATAETDAFFVAWTIPESATPIMMEGAMSALLVPLFSHDLERTGTFKHALGGVLFPLLLLFGALALLTAVAAPLIVDVLAPGLDDRSAGIENVRIASLTILFMGISGYLMAALRSKQIFGWPASVYIAYNVGILATIVVLHHELGIVAAAVGLAVGAACMVLIQLPVFLKVVEMSRPTLRPPRELLQRLSGFFSLATYSIARHGQVYVERIAGSLLAAGTITHLNYATKVAQLPMMMALTVPLVTLPELSRSAAAGREDRFRSIVERNLRLGTFFIFPIIGLLLVLGSSLVAVLFERGAFESSDTAATADILRIYCLGLLGQVLLGTTVPVHVSRPGKTWLPARAAGLGLVLTVAATAAAAPLLGGPGIALANALGVSLMAVILLRKLPARGVEIDLPGLAGHAARCAASTAVAAGIVAAGKSLLPPLEAGGHVAVLVIGGGIFLALYLAFGRTLQVRESSRLVTALGRSLRRTRRR